MKQYRVHTSIETHRAWSVFPPELQMTIVQLAGALAHKKDVRALLDDFRAGISALETAVIVRAGDEIRQLAGIHGPKEEQLSGATGVLAGLGAVFAKAGHSGQGRAFQALETIPGMSVFLQFHGDGRVRQAALEAMTGPPQSAFEFAAIAARLNDWVPQVRDAAVRYASVQFAQTGARVVAAAAFYLLVHAEKPGRWGGREKALIRDTVNRKDVLQVLCGRLLGPAPGAAGMVLLHLLREPVFDDWLERLARSARLPDVRAIALGTLLSGRARWPAGYDRQWIDKRYGLSRRVRTFGERRVEHRLDVAELMARAAGDRAVRVRKTAADCLILLRADATPGMDELAGKLARDKAASVRSRANYYLVQRGLA